jgi:drug/metabolite transporter (DMT)-like permease
MARARLGVAWMFLATALFAVMGVSARMVSRDVPWQEVCGARMLVGGLVALIVAKVRGQSLAIAGNKKLAWLRTIFGTLSAAGTFFVFAQPGLALGDAVTLFATAPLFVALLSWPLLGEKVRAGTGAAIAVAFVGILVVAQPSFDTAGGVVVVGTLTAMGSALAMISLRKVGPGESSEAIVFHFMCFGTLAMAVLSIPVWRTPDTTSALYLLLTGTTGGLAQLAMTRAYSLDNAARVSAVGYLQIVFTRALALPVFDEVPTPVQAAGSLLIIGAGVSLALFVRKR